jgi:hypothetical protein
MRRRTIKTDEDIEGRLVVFELVVNFANRKRTVEGRRTKGSGKPAGA